MTKKKESQKVVVETIWGVAMKAWMASEARRVEFRKAAREKQG